MNKFTPLHLELLMNYFVSAADHPKLGEVRVYDEYADQLASFGLLYTPKAVQQTIWVDGKPQAEVEGCNIYHITRAGKVVCEQIMNEASKLVLEL